LRIVDVGGQRSERRKWIHCFEEVTVIFFIVAISEYNQMLREDESTNRLFEALNLFQEIINCDWFRGTPLLLFLNKSDLFKEKLNRVPLNSYFPDFTGGSDFNKATKFIETKFTSTNQNKKRMIYSHVTCATDTEIVKSVFRDFQTIFLSRRMDEAGLI